MVRISYFMINYYVFHNFYVNNESCNSEIMIRFWKKSFYHISLSRYFYFAFFMFFFGTSLYCTIQTFLYTIFPCLPPSRNPFTGNMRLSSPTTWCLYYLVLQLSILIRNLRKVRRDDVQSHNAQINREFAIIFKYSLSLPLSHTHIHIYTYISKISN